MKFMEAFNNVSIMKGGNNVADKTVVIKLRKWSLNCQGSNWNKSVQNLKKIKTIISNCIMFNVLC